MNSNIFSYFVNSKQVHSHYKNVNLVDNVNLKSNVFVLDLNSHCVVDYDDSDVNNFVLVVIYKVTNNLSHFVNNNYVHVLL